MVFNRGGHHLDAFGRGDEVYVIRVGPPLVVQFFDGPTGEHPGMIIKGGVEVGLLHFSEDIKDELANMLLEEVIKTGVMSVEGLAADAGLSGNLADGDLVNGLILDDVNKGLVDGGLGLDYAFVNLPAAGFVVIRSGGRSGAFNKGVAGHGPILLPILYVHSVRYVCRAVYA